MGVIFNLCFVFLVLLQYNSIFVHSNNNKILQCCAYPVLSFINRHFSGACGCQSLSQKWQRYKDWIQLNGGYIHDALQFQHTPNNQTSTSNINHGIFCTRNINMNELLMQIPFSITFSQFIISKHMKIKKSKLILKLFKKKRKNFHWISSSFPTWNEFNSIHNLPSTKVSRIWLALGFAWLKKYTYELLPWFELLSDPNNLPLMWNANITKLLLKDTIAIHVINDLQSNYAQITAHYLLILKLNENEVKQAYAWICSHSFSLSFSEIYNGGKHSPSIPCGHDFLNHNIFKSSSTYHHPYLGRYRKIKRFQNNQNGFDFRKYEIENKRRKEAMFIYNTVEKERKIVQRSRAKLIDFQSVFLWIDYNVEKGDELFLNYGRYSSSGYRFARYGFIDDEHPYDFLYINIKIRPIIIENNDGNNIYLYDFWRIINNLCGNDQIFDIIIHYNGGYSIKLKNGLMMKCIRLHCLSLLSVIDSFTISSILNNFEGVFVGQLTDVCVQRLVHEHCELYVNKFADYYEEGYERLLNEYGIIVGGKLTEWQINDVRKVMEYRMREKEFYFNCTLATVVS